MCVLFGFDALGDPRTLLSVAENRCSKAGAWLRPEREPPPASMQGPLWQRVGDLSASSQATETPQG